MFVLTEGVQVSEYGVALQTAGIGDLQVIGIGEHVHHLLLDLSLGVGQVDAVAQRFAHLGLAVCAGEAAADLILGHQGLRLHQGFSIGQIEPAHNFPGLLQHRQLILSHRYSRGPEGGDVRRLADGVREEAHGNAGFEVPQLDLRLHRGIPLKPGHSD